MLSANKGHLEVVKMLLKAGAPVNYQTDVSIISSCMHGYALVSYRELKWRH